MKATSAQRGKRLSQTTATRVRPRLTIRTSPGKRRAQRAGPSSRFCFAQGLRTRSYARCETASGSQWTSGRRVCTSTGNQRFGVVMNARRPTRSASATKRRCSLLPADVLDHRVREDDVEGAVLERQLERVGLDVARVRVARAEARRPRAGRRAVSCAGHGYISSKKFSVPQLPSLALSSPKAKSSTPTSSTVVSPVGAIVSMKRPNLRRRERSEIWSASLIRRQE